MPRSTCGGCNKIFSSTSAFDAHRTGGWEEAIYENGKSGRSHGKIVGHTPVTRRCMTTDEMLATGRFAVERKPHPVFRDGRRSMEERDIWYDPVARESLRQAYQSDEDEE